MRELLEQNNVALLHEVRKLQRSLTQASRNVPKELKGYTGWVTKVCEDFSHSVLQNLKYLESERQDLLEDILSETQKVSRDFYVFNRHHTTPILRARRSDRLPLKLLLWLHATHPKTKDIPVAVCDGEFSIWLTGASIYFTPCAAQQGLLNLPLFFHEFGHLLYSCYREEMNDLVRELQAEIKRLLLPDVIKNDRYTEKRETNQAIIVATWRTWAEEFFCDAVGFVMGGTSFTSAFSMYLRMLGRSQYHVEKLAHRSHPVPWIRIQLLADRARQMGCNAVADDLEDEWNRIASALGIVENYYGFYHPTFLPIIQQKLDDMLTETEPRAFQELEIAEQELELNFTSPVALLNSAWLKFRDDPGNYQDWEENAISLFLDDAGT